MTARLESNGKYWQAAYISPSGRTFRRSLGSKDKLSRDDALIRCAGIETLGPVDHLQAWSTLYLAQRTDLSESTRLNQSHTITRLLEHFGDIRLTLITRAGAAAFRASLTDCGLVTQAKHVSIARQIMGYAHRQDRIPFNPFDRERVKAPHVERQWRYVTLPELDLILAACPNDDWRLVFMLARLAGLRRNEIDRAHNGWVDLDARRLTVEAPGGRETTKHRRRVVPVVPRLLEALQGREGRLAGAWNGEGYGAKARQIITAAGLQPWPKVLQNLRANRATDWLAEFPTMTACAWMGHDPSVAARHYFNVRDEEFAQATGAVP